MTIEKLLRHNGEDAKLNEKVIKEYLYYSSTKQSYCQRECKYDESVLLTASCNDYIKYYLKKVLDLKEIDIRIDQNDDWIRDKIKDIKTNCMYINKGRQKFYYDFIEFIRNSIAHGQYNCVDDKMIFINQYKPKEESVIKYMMVCDKKNISNKLVKICNRFENFYKNEDDIKYICMFDDQYNKRKRALKSKVFNKKIVIRYCKNQMLIKKDVVNIFKQYKKEKNIIIVINAKTKVKIKNRIDENKNEIVTQDELLKRFSDIDEC